MSNDLVIKFNDKGKVIDIVSPNTGLYPTKEAAKEIIDYCIEQIAIQGTIDTLNLKIQIENGSVKIPNEIKPPRKGFIYLMKDEINDFYKIGFSNNPTYRESTLLSQKPTIKLVYTCEGSLSDEMDLHKLLHKKRIRGEWFDITTEEWFQALHQVIPNPITPLKDVNNG